MSGGGRMMELKGLKHVFSLFLTTKLEQIDPSVSKPACKC